MQLDKIFELVRREDVVLWIGSGFSLYAGYPTGAGLTKIIYDNLSSYEKSQIQDNLSLMDLAEEFVRLKAGSRNALTSIIKAEFSKNPSSRRWHELLADIPHITTIITTNYDRLFEDSYKEINTIISPIDIAYRDKKVELFKVHGDIASPDSIIITRSDYTKFFHKKTAENLLWTAVKEKISSRSVVFIGYDLEDENTKVILSEIEDALGNNRKEMFLIAPNFKSHKIQYLNQKGIQYLDYKGEVFVKKLYENIQENIANDFERGQISAETLRAFFHKNNLKVDLTSDAKSYKIKSVNGLNKTSKGNLTIKFNNDQDLIQSFRQFASGERFGQITLDGNNLEKLKFVLNGIKLLDDPSNYRLVLKSKPQKEGTCAVVFEDGSEFDDINYSVFRSKLTSEVRAIYKKCEFRFSFSQKDIETDNPGVSPKFTYEQQTNFNTINDAILVHKLLLNIVSHLGFTIYLDGSTDGVYFKSEDDGDFQAKQVRATLDFLESLKKIEKHFKLRFTNFGKWTNEDLDNVEKARLVATGEVQIQLWDEELKFNLNDGVSLDSLLTSDQELNFLIESQNCEEITIFGQKIILGYLVGEPLDLYVTNRDEVRVNKSAKLKFRSKSKQIKISYKPETLNGKHSVGN